MQDNKADKVTLNYINPDAPRVAPPAYPGEYYDAQVPATLDLAERARLCVNALTECTDPDYDDEMYWIVDLLAREPGMYHTVDDHVQAKFFQALPLDRTACGSAQNIDVEHRLMQMYLKMQGPDGLTYIPIKSRPWALPAQPNVWAGLDYLPTGDHWCSISQTGRLLGGFCIYALKDPSGPWAEAARRLARGLMNLCIVEGDIAYLCENCTEPGRPVTKPAARPVRFRAAIAAWVAQGLAQCARALGDREVAGRPVPCWVCEVQGHGVYVEFLVIQLHRFLVNGNVNRLAVNVNVSRRTPRSRCPWRPPFCFSMGSRYTVW